MKTVLVDLDGVLNEYCGDYKEDFIPALREHAKEFLEILSKNYKVVIFSSRPEKLVQKWIKENSLSSYIDYVTKEKKPAFVQLDDRCIKFNGNYTDAIENIKNFKPFWKKSN